MFDNLFKQGQEWAELFNYRNLTEIFKCAVEYRQFQASWPALKLATPEGDGHPVLVLPGFVSDDLPTAPLRNALREKGYNAYGWENGNNWGLTDETVRKLPEMLKKLYKDNGNRKVTLIGHSLGGIYARELAREFPELVRDVISVGTPFGVGIQKNEVPLKLQQWIEGYSANHLTLGDEERARRLLTPPPVPTTSIFSKIDGIGGWRACLNPDIQGAENIEVEASHVGLIWHSKTIAVILDRLSQPEGKWQRHKDAAHETTPNNPGYKIAPQDHTIFKHS